MRAILCNFSAFLRKYLCRVTLPHTKQPYVMDGRMMLVKIQRICAGHGPPKFANCIPHLKKFELRSFEFRLHVLSEGQTLV